MQAELFYDNEHEALRATVEMLGGVKRVASDLWPAKSLVDAQRYLLKCMDPERAEKLALDEFFHIWRLARSKGVHILAEYVGQKLDYEIRPITTEQKQASLLERFEVARAEMHELAKLFAQIPTP